MTRNKEDSKSAYAKRWPVPVRPTIEMVRKLIDYDYFRLGVGNDYSEDKIKQYHGQKFDVVYGGDARSADLRLLSIRQVLATRKAHRDRLQDDVDAAPLTDKTVATEPPPPMPWPERFTMFFYAFVLLVTYALSGAVVYANIERTQPEVIANGSLALYTYFAIPLFFPIILDIIAGSFASVAVQQRFHLMIRCFALVGCLLFLITWSLESYESSRPIQARFEDAFDKATRPQASDASSTEQVRAILAPYALFIQLAAEGLLLTTLWSAVMKIWRTYARLRPTKSDGLMVMEASLSAIIIEIEALEEHEAAMAQAVNEFTERRADLIAEAAAKYIDANSRVRHPGDDGTVRQFRRS